MQKRFRTIGIVLAVLGLVFMAVGGYAYTKVQEGENSLQKFSEAQNVTLNYNDEGQLVDRGTTEGAQAIMTMLTDEWGYPVVEAELDPNDPLVNTGSEYMYQMAVVAYHTLHGTQTITLTEDVEYNGELFTAGTYEFPVDGRYWTDFDRQHPIEGPARAATWTGTAHALVAELGVGTVTASALQMGLGLAGAFASLGLLALVAGAGMIWISRSKDSEMFTISEKVPESLPVS